ncbi:MAG: hypothetical protein JW776_02430 [Candidatus Lokiarchaeota archaeon]|nr:hypothetical protein [Candidatus Lokiarchaeota archaeon]
MKKFHRKLTIIVCITYLVGMGLYLPFYPVAAYPTYPTTGIIAMWTGSELPEGWEIVTETNSRFVMATTTGEIPGATGGVSSHRHGYTQIPTHTHGYTNTIGVTHSHSYTGGGSTANKGTAGSDIRTFYTGSQSSIGGSISAHVHTVYPTGYSTCYTESSSLLPPYQTVTYIKKVSATALYPAGLIVISTGDSIPSGWVRCDGSSGTPDLRGDFLMGSLTPGSMGGTTSHNHVYREVPYHSHTMQSDGGSHTHGAYHSTTYVKADDWSTFAYDVVVATLSQSSTYHLSHSHSVPYIGSSTCYTQTVSHLPPYIAVDFLMSTQDTSALPVGVVALWDSVDSSIPYGWNMCDGSYGTADFRNRFIRGRNTEPIGSLGGSSAHSHSYSTVPSHTHSVSSGDAYHAHQMYVYGGLTAGAETLLGLGSNVYIEGGSRTTTSSTYSHRHYINSAGVSNPSTQTASNYPPYVKFTYIQCIDYDGISPVFSSTPADKSLEYGYASESISWTAIDGNPNTYSIDLLGTGTIVSPTPWNSGNPITFTIPDGFGVGSYTYVIELLDMYGNPSTDSVTLTVEDTTKPIITEYPIPLTVQFGYDGQSYSWTATDLNADTYSIELIGTGIVEEPTAWTSDAPIVYNIPEGFGVGTYTYTITFLDLYGNSESDTITFNVEDTTHPIIHTIPSDLVLEFGDTAPVLLWNATDPYPGVYNITIDDVLYAINYPWISGSPIEFDIDPFYLDVNTYTLTITVSDLYGNYASDSVSITIQDTTTPVITDTPFDIAADLGYTNRKVTWTATDYLPDTYTIELGGTGIVVDHIKWTSGEPVTYTFPDGFASGTYTYTITFYDEQGNSVTDRVLFIVRELPPRTIPGFNFPFLIIISISSVIMLVLVQKHKKNRAK